MARSTSNQFSSEFDSEIFELPTVGAHLKACSLLTHRYYSQTTYRRFAGKEPHLKPHNKYGIYEIVSSIRVA